MILITGATGSLGKLIVKYALDNWGGSLPIAATYHRTPPSELPVHWIPWSLSESALSTEQLGFPRRLLVFHFACTVQNDFRSVLGIDVPGTLSLMNSVASLPNTDVLFIFASSTAASDARTPYGFGKKHLESALSRSATRTAEVRSVRIPIVEDDDRTYFHISQAEFAGWFTRKANVNQWLAQRFCD